MILKKAMKYAELLEDPENPLLGPTIKLLYLFGVWQTGPKLRNIIYNFVHFNVLLFVISECIDLYSSRHDINNFLNNMSMSILSIICFIKCASFVLWQVQWRKLFKEISEKEISQIKQNDPIVKKHMDVYTKYVRMITYSYWVLVFLTNCFLIMNPLLRYVTSDSYRIAVANGTEPLPQILFSWFPFDNKKYPGYWYGMAVHIFMGCQGSGVLAGFDMNAIAIMCYLKGQMLILKDKCNNIFIETRTNEEVVSRIKECHQSHCTLIRIYQMFNSLLSPVMFLYMLLCSIGICGSVVQFISKAATVSQKLWVVEFTFGLVFQLFLYCWHGNEVTVVSKEIDCGVYSSDWWKGNKITRKQILLLSGKLNYPFVLQAGRFTTLSVASFIDILKRTYSFFTLFSQMQED